MFIKTYKNQFTARRPFLAVAKQLYTCVILFFLHLIFHPLAAQTIGNWTFNNVLSGTPGSYNTVSNADFAAAVPTRSFNGGVEYFGENGWPAGSVNNNMYLQFSLSPLAGYQLDISSLVLRMRRSNTGSPAGAGPTSWTLRSSLDGFTTDIATGSITHNYADYTVIPGAFVNIYTTVTFRLYGYNTVINSGGNSRLVMDNIRVNGIGYLLPVKLGAINGQLNGENAHISFTVYQTEINSRYYLERSQDGIRFNTVYKLEEKDAAASKTYSYADNLQLVSTAAIYYYRVRLQNNDGRNSFSNTITLRKHTVAATIQPYIKNGLLYLNGPLPAEGQYEVAVFNTGGQVLAHLYFSGPAGYNTIALPIPVQVPAVCVVRICHQKGYSASAVTLNR